MALDFNKYSGNNDFRGFLSGNGLGVWLNSVGNDGKVNQDALKKDIYGAGRLLGDNATNIRFDQSRNNNDGNFANYNKQIAYVNGLYNQWQQNNDVQRGSDQQRTPDLGSATFSNASFGGGSGGSVGSYSAPRIDQQQIALFNQAEGGINNSIGRLDNQLNIARQNINDQFNVRANELNSGRDSSQQQFQQGITQNQQQLRTNNNTIADQASAGLRGLQRRLGAMGAAGSSDRFLASDAVSDQANQQRSGATSAFAKNAQELDNNWNNYLGQFNNEKKKLEEWKGTQEKQAESQSLTTRADLLSRLGQIRGQRSAAQGGSSAAAAQPLLDQANALSGRIDELGRISPIYDGKAPAYQQKSLDSFRISDPVAVRAAETGGNGPTDTPALSLLLGKNQEDKDKNKGFGLNPFL